jgi:hypothetical protein
MDVTAFLELGLEPEEAAFLNQICARQVDGYRDFKRLSRGKTRSISIPHQTLDMAQRKILAKLQSFSTGYISKASHAYVRGRSTFTAASEHAGTTWAVKVDISAFFDNVTEIMVEAVLNRHFGKSGSKIATRLCTRVPIDHPSHLARKHRVFSRTVLKSLSESLHQQDPALFRRRFKRRSITETYVLPPKSLKRFVQQGGLLQHDAEFERERLSYLSKIVQLESRMRHYRRAIFSAINRGFLAKINNDELQRSYTVRPSQFRYRTKTGYLPQGAATSGIIANLVMFDFDEVMRKYCEKHSLRYTRYSDDIFISSSKNTYNKDFALRILSFTQQLCEYHGFTLNKSKTKILTPGSRKFMLGLLVDGPTPRLPSIEKERIRKALWVLANSTLQELLEMEEAHILNETHALPNKRIGSYKHPSVGAGLLDSLRGWLCYCKAVDKAFLVKLQKELSCRKWKFKVDLIEKEIQLLIASLLDDKPLDNPEKLKQPKLDFRDIADLF